MADSPIQGLLSQLPPDVSAQLQTLMGSGGLTEEEKKQQRQQAFFSAAAAALSNMYKPTGQGLGAALSGGLLGYNEAGQSIRRDKLAGAENMQKAIQSYGAIQGLQDQARQRKFDSEYQPMQGPQLPSMAPTPQNAAALASAPQPTIYNQLLAQAAAARKAGVDPKPYLLMAEKYAPKYKGMETVMGPDGKPTLLQTYDNQAPAPVQGGYQPKPDMVSTDVGGKVVWNDKLRLQNGQEFTKTFTPEGAAAAANAAAHLRLAQDAASRDKGQQFGTPIQVTDTEGGTSLYVPQKGTNQVVPMVGPDGKPVNKSASIPQAYKEKAYNLANLRDNMTAYNDAIKNLKPADLFKPSVAADIKAKYGATQMGLKNLFELGVIAGPDMEIMAQNLTDPTSAKGLMLGQTGGLEAQHKVLFKMLDNADKNLAGAYNQKPKHAQKNDYSSLSNDDIMKALQSGH